MVPNNFIDLFSSDVTVSIKPWGMVVGMCFLFWGYVLDKNKTRYLGTLQEFCLFVKETNFEIHLVGKCLVL